MINILIPLAGPTPFFNTEEYFYPKPLIEIKDKSMIQLAIENLSTIHAEKQFIFVVNNEDCVKYHLDDVLTLLTSGNLVIIRIDHYTKGAACSALLAIHHINNANELIISNGDQIVDVDFDLVLEEFRARRLDGGLMSFDSIHPRWSYARVAAGRRVVETSEKRPISRNAIAGFYYFRNGKEFVESAMSSIEKNASVNGLFYIAPTYNEMILRNKIVDIYPIDNSRYHTFYTPQKIKEYESRHG